MLFLLHLQRGCVVRILALDLASKTGWAAWDGADVADANGERAEGSGLVASGVQSFPRSRGDSLGMFLLRFRGWIRRTVAEFRPDVIAHELSIVGPRANKLAIDMEALLRTECAAQGLENVGVPVGTLKKHATGNGRASKAEMVQAALDRWGVEIEDDNHADALCVLAWVLEDVGEAS